MGIIWPETGREGGGGEETLPARDFSPLGSLLARFARHWTCYKLLKTVRRVTPTHRRRRAAIKRERGLTRTAPWRSGNRYTFLILRGISLPRPRSVYEADRQDSLARTDDPVKRETASSRPAAGAGVKGRF